MHQRESRLRMLYPALYKDEREPCLSDEREIRDGWGARARVWCGDRAALSHTMYLSISLNKTNPPENRQLDILISHSRH